MKHKAPSMIEGAFFMGTVIGREKMKQLFCGIQS
ncbi:MAG: hypothetical protein PWP06_700 [Candidatus Marinimicrobia bacterium]|jgi:hypothetical protein|nr:hypothetical protein [Candidatus Neomarinimicrobiota bacterium]